MEIENLIEITPEIKKEAYDLLRASERLHELLKEQGGGHFSMSIFNTSTNELTIYDRHEYSEDGEGNDLGFFAHRFFADGEYKLNFIAEKNEEAQEFDRQFNEFMEGEEV